MLTTLTAYKSVIYLGPFPTSYGGVVEELQLPLGERERDEFLLGNYIYSPLQYLYSPSFVEDSMGGKIEFQGRPILTWLRQKEEWMVLQILYVVPHFMK